MSEQVAQVEAGTEKVVKQRGSKRGSKHATLSRAQGELLRAAILSDYRSGKVQGLGYDADMARRMNESRVFGAFMVQPWHVSRQRVTHLHIYGKKNGHGMVPVYTRKWERKASAPEKPAVIAGPAAIGTKLRGEVDKAGKRRLLREIIERLQALSSVI